MKLIRHLARLPFAGQHARQAGHARSGAGTIVAMKDNEQTIAQRIKELEGAARKSRLEAMQIAATLLMKENALLAEPRANSNDKGDIAALRARYPGPHRQIARRRARHEVSPLGASSPSRADAITHGLTLRSRAQRGVSKGGNEHRACCPCFETVATRLRAGITPPDSA
jgi:hypothetical protein